MPLVSYHGDPGLIPGVKKMENCHGNFQKKKRVSENHIRIILGFLNLIKKNSQS